MNHPHKLEGNMHSCKPTVVPVLALLMFTGCQFDAKGTGVPAQPGLGCYDLEPTELSVVDESDAAFQVDGVVYEYEPLSLVWNACYELGTNQDPLISEPFTTRLRIFSVQDDELEESFLDEFFPSDYIETGECRDEEFYVAEGLPAGSYRAYAILDTDDLVEECTGLAYSFTNTVEVDFEVVAGPADDLEFIAPEGEGDDGQDEDLSDVDDLQSPDGDGDDPVRVLSADQADDSDSKPPARAPVSISATQLEQRDPAVTRPAPVQIVGDLQWTGNGK